MSKFTRDGLLLIEVFSQKLSIYTADYKSHKKEEGYFPDQIQIHERSYKKECGDSNFLGFYDFIISDNKILHKIGFDDKCVLPDSVLNSPFINVDVDNDFTYTINIVDDPTLNDSLSLSMYQTVGDSNLYLNSSGFLFVMDLYRYFYEEFESATKNLTVKHLGYIK